MSDKLISFMIPTRKRVERLKNAINSILEGLDDTSKVELILKIDTDDIDTISEIKNLPFDKLYINNVITDYHKNHNFNKFIDMHIVISDRGNGYKDLHKFSTEMFKVSKGKWLIPFGDDMKITSNNWYDEMIRIDSVNKIVMPRLNSWNYLVVRREIPELWGHMCPNTWMDQWYDEIATKLDLYVDSNISFSHDRVMEGETAIQRERYFRELEKSPKWVNNAWQGGPPDYDIKDRDRHIEMLRQYLQKSNYVSKQYAQKLNNFFESIDNKNNITMDNKILFNFINGAFVEITGIDNKKYIVKFIDTETNEIIHQSEISNNCWTKTNRQWLTNWKVQVLSNENIIQEHNFDVTDKKVYIHLSSESIGDTLAWFPYVEEFRKKYKCEVICSTFHNYLFEDTYPNIKFVKPGTTVYDLYAMYEIGIYDGDFNRNKTDHKNIPLQQVASDILGLEFKEIRPDIKINNLKKNEINEKYVVIATESTAQCKLWNYHGGWQKVVDYLNKKGYKVVVVQKEKTDLKGVIHKVGNKKLEDAVDIINNAEFFIGVSSGLSWIAWALQKKVILISGFTSPWYEFGENCYRINNIHSCKGCWHEHVFDKSDWTWCPMKKNFECSSTILPEAVFAQIETIINDLDKFYTTISPNELVDLTNTSIGFEFQDARFGDAQSMFYEIFKSRMYDFNKCMVEEGDVVLDIGANIGIFTRYATANNAKIIYSFEPIKENYDLLVKNTEGFNVVPFNYGISDICGMEIFHIDGTSGGHTLLDANTNNSNTNEIREIKCYTLDDMFEKNIIPEKIDFMKIDAEGAEIKILKGISDENIMKIRKIVLEWHQFLFTDKNLINEITTRFSNLGFKFYLDHVGTDLITIYLWKD